MSNPLGRLTIEIPTIVVLSPLSEPEGNTEFPGSSSSNGSDDNSNDQNETPAGAPAISKRGPPSNYYEETVSKERCWEIINSIVNRTSLPSHLKEMPMHLAMSTLLISTSGFMTKQITIAAGALISKMNGTVTPNYTAGTTHIVATHGLTEKVTLARKRQLPVMTLEWVNAVWKACEHDPYVHASQPKFQNYTCPLFHNVSFCISDTLGQDNKMILQGLITRNGGKLIDEVKKDQTDILICKHTQELCYFQANHVNIPIVSPAWVTVAILDNIIPDYVGYQVKKLETVLQPTTSTTLKAASYPTESAIESWNIVKNINEVTHRMAHLSLQSWGARSVFVRPALPPVPIKPPETSLSPLISSVEVSSDEQLGNLVRSFDKITKI